MSPVEGYGIAKSLRSSFWRKSHENMTKIVHLIQLSHIPSTSLNFSIVTFKAPLFRKEVIGWKEAIASRRLGTKKVDVLKKLSTTAELEKYSINGYILYKKLRVFLGIFSLYIRFFPNKKYWQHVSGTTSFSLKSFQSLYPIYQFWLWEFRERQSIVSWNTEVYIENPLYLEVQREIENWMYSHLKNG